MLLKLTFQLCSLILYFLSGSFLFFFFLSGGGGWGGGGGVGGGGGGTSARVGLCLSCEGLKSSASLLVCLPRRLYSPTPDIDQGISDVSAGMPLADEL